VLHDEKEILEVNPAAVRILGRQKPEEVIGRHPRELAPHFSTQRREFGDAGKQTRGKNA